MDDWNATRPLTRQCRVVWVWVCLAMASVATAQVAPPSENLPIAKPPAASPAGPPSEPPAALDAPAEKKLGYTVVPSPGGLYVYEPGRWGTVAISLQNAGEEPAEITCATFFDVEPTLQYGRRLWMPGRARLKVSHPILVPAGFTEKVIPYHSVVESSGERIREDHSQVRHSGRFLISSKRSVVAESMNERTITGLIQDLVRDDNQSFNPPFDAIVACRVKLNQGRLIADQRDELLPPEAESYAAIDQLVICSDRVLNDPAALVAIRQWLGAGGRLWIMLDSLDPQMLPAIFGDEWKGEFIDRTWLNQVAIEPARERIGHPTAMVEYNTPVKFARLITTDEDVWYTVNGWPAAFWKSYGAGRVLVTTLDPVAWVRLNASSAREAVRLRQASEAAAQLGRDGTGIEPPVVPDVAPPQVAKPSVVPEPPRPASGGPAVEAMEYSLFDPNESLHHLAEEFFSRRPPETSIASLVEEHAGEYIGYRIPSRNSILGVLIGFVLALTAIGLAMWRINRLELLGWSIPILALAASGWLIWLGKESRQASPPMLALVQIVKAVSGSQEFSSSGFGALYSPEGKERVLGMDQGGRMTPDMTGMSGVNRRMEWTDLGRWNWVNLNLPPAQRPIEYVRSGTTKGPLTAEATFGPEGLTGNLLLGDSTGASDVIIATSEGRLGVKLKPDGAFTASAGDALSENQYVSADFLTDEQNRRQRTMRRVLSAPDNLLKSNPVVIMAWTDPWVEGLRLDETRSVKGAALVQMPLTISRPKPGPEFIVPELLMKFRNLRGNGPDGITSSPMWNFNENRGADRTQPGTSWFQFESPVPLEPFEALAARVRLEVLGPIGRVELAGFKEGRVHVLKEWIDPVGRLDYEITDPGVLTVTEGSFILRVSGGDPARPQLNTRVENGEELKSTWRIESLSIELKARTLPTEGD